MTHAPGARAIATVEEFYAHALAIELEAAERYGEFAVWFAERGEDVLAGLARQLSQHEHEHFSLLSKRCRGLSLPAIPAEEYRWLDAHSPEAPAREAFYRIANARQLLEVALAGECNALAFFVEAARGASHAEVRALAHEMAAEEARHVGWVRNALEYHPGSHPDWDALLRAGIEPGTFTAD